MRRLGVLCCSLLLAGLVTVGPAAAPAAAQDACDLDCVVQQTEACLAMDPLAAVTCLVGTFRDFCKPGICGTLGDAFQGVLACIRDGVECSRPPIWP